MKMPNLTFCRGREHSRTICQDLTIEQDGISLKKQHALIFEWRFHCCHHHCCLSSLFINSRLYCQKKILGRPVTLNGNSILV